MESLNKQKFSFRYITIAYLIPFILQIMLFGYQVSKGIVSVWNIITIVMMIFLYGYAIRNMKKANFNVEEIITKNKEKFNTIIKQQKEKTSKKTRLIVLFIAIIFGAISALFFYLHSSKTEGLEIVNSRVVDQWGETTVVIEETDEGIQETESDYIEVTVEYEFKGETKGAVIKATTTDKIYVDELKIFIDEEGKFVADYGRLMVWKFEAIVFLSCAIILLLCSMFALAGEFIGGSIFMLIGTALMFVISSPLFENFLYNDLTCFTLLFANVGVCLLICGIFVMIFGRYSVYGLYNTELANKSTFNEFGETIMVEDVEQKCECCGEKIAPTDKFCGNCGMKINR